MNFLLREISVAKTVRDRWPRVTRSSVVYASAFAITLAVCGGAIVKGTTYLYREAAAAPIAQHDGMGAMLSLTTAPAMEVAIVSGDPIAAVARTDERPASSVEAPAGQPPAAPVSDTPLAAIAGGAEGLKPLDAKPFGLEPLSAERASPARPGTVTPAGRRAVAGSAAATSGRPNSGTASGPPRESVAPLSSLLASAAPGPGSAEAAAFAPTAELPADGVANVADRPFEALGSGSVPGADAGTKTITRNLRPGFELPRGPRAVVEVILPRVPGKPVVSVSPRLPAHVDLPDRPPFVP